MEFLKHNLILWFWVAFWAYWFLASLFVKRVAERQSAPSRLRDILLTIPAFFLLFDPRWGVGWLGKNFLPPSAAMYACGVVLTALGLGFAVWARVFLGGNWSASVTVKQDHTLIRTGPYRWVRHPIYTGILLGALGTALAVSQWRALCGVVVMTFAFYVKARHEETMMVQTFGAQYDDYKNSTGMLMPGIG
jgi:protein-S-isoprenylcysteine O-methyltransferase Ste14